MLGLNFLVDSQVDQAVEELTHAASTEPEALEIQMILGNLYREKGQVGRSVAVHQALLKRPDLTELEHAYVLLCLGLDFRHGGFVDRALEAFQEVLQLDPLNRYALINLQKLYEDQHQWADALEIRERIAKIDAGRRPDDQQILGFLRNEIGSAQKRDGDEAAAARTFAEAIDADARTTPAYLNLGDSREKEGRLAAAVEVWEQLIEAVPDHAHFAFDRLERAYRTLGTPHRFVELCERLIERDPLEWRARLALSKHLSAAGQHRDAFDRLLDALPHHPHELAMHQQAWEILASLDFDTALIRRYVNLTREAVFYLDPPHLPEVPLPQRRAALAVPAVPRVEHLRARANDAGQGGDRPEMKSIPKSSGRGHLPQLESEGISVLREVAAQFERPALLFSGGKDSIVVAWLARKAFSPARVPFPLLHIDTGHNFPETLGFRDDFVRKMNCTLLVRHVQDSIDQGRVQEETGASASRNALQTVTLLDAIKELGLDAAIGGAGRDATRRKPERRSASFRTVTCSVSGIRGISARNCGTCTTGGRTTASIFACFRCRTGPNSTSGSTSPPKTSRYLSCISPTVARS